MGIRRVLLYITISALLSISITGCEPKHLGPQVRRDGVYFSYYAPAAKHIAIAGRFNQWDVDADVLTGPDRNGVWSIILPLPAGRYEYLYYVDKDWKLDPETPSVDDGFGGRNSVVVIGK